MDQVETESENEEENENSDESISNSEDSISLESEKEPPADDLSMTSKDREQVKQRKMLADKINIKDTTYVSHTQSNKVTDPWNKVLFEIKLLRNYFVNEAVLPAQKS